MGRVCTKCQFEKSDSAFAKASVQSRSGDGLRRWCRDCDKEYRKANTERRAALAIEYADRNREKMREYHAARYQRQKPFILARNALWRGQNKERMTAAAREWRHRNSERVKANKHRRRAAERGACGTYTSEDIARIYELQRGKCPVCRVDLGAAFHRDHTMPLARGGTNDPENIQLLCAHCNQTKNARDPVEYMQDRGFLL